MRRVLIGWQLGGGHGHVTKMLAVARALSGRGFEVLLAVRDPVLVLPLTRDAGFPVLPVPPTKPRPYLVPPGQMFLSRSYADVLAVHGYGDSSVLYAEAVSWRALLDVVKPDLVLAEFAPLLCMVTHGCEPCLAFGSGYSLPALGADGFFPVVEPAGTELMPQAALRDNIAGVMRQLNLPLPENPLQAMLGKTRKVVTFEEVDPYREVRARMGDLPACGPMSPLPSLVPSMPTRPACLLYLPANHPGLVPLVEGLAEVRLPGLAYVRGEDSRLRDALARAGLQVSMNPLDIQSVLPKVSVVVHHAGLGTTERALAYGRPQVLLPTSLEQALTARQLNELGVGRLVSGASGMRQIARHIHDVAHNATMIAAAQALAGHLQNSYHTDVLADIVAACEAGLPESSVPA